MLRKYYEELSNETRKRIQQFQKELHLIETSGAFEGICNLQNEIIQFGTMLEQKYHLESSLSLHTLERMTELLYSLSITDDEDERRNMFACLDKDLNSFDETLKNSVTIKDVSLSLVLIIKNEADYIREWLEFHIMVGVQHFYIYDNESQDNLLEILKPYIQQDIVTYHKVPGENIQIESYNHALQNYRYDTKYMGFIDTDEFLFPVKGESLPETIDQIIDDFHKKDNRIDYAGGIGVNWRVYGPGYHKEKPNGLVIENYRYRGPDSYEMNELIKVICNPTVVERFHPNPHNVKYASDRIVTISENGSTIPRAFFYDSKCEKIRINHYYTRSEEEYHIKVFERGWTGVSEEFYEKLKQNYARKILDCYEVEDYCMERFVKPLKKRLDKETKNDTK